MVDMPRGVHCVDRGGRMTYRFAPYRGTKWQDAARPFWRSLGDDPIKAAAEAKRLWTELGPRLDALRQPSSHPEIDAAVKQRVDYSRVRAREKGLDFALDDEGVLEMVRHQGYRCLVSGVEFSLQKWGRRMPFAPSIDRIDPARGYTLGNIRVVSAIANMAMSDWGLTALQTFSKGVAQQMSSKGRFVPLVTTDKACANEINELH